MKGLGSEGSVLIILSVCIKLVSWLESCIDPFCEIIPELLERILKVLM